ncbi:YafY family transcriptional regulator [Flavobacterium salilacus subsp. salilacus]|uniref:helix-turn-helix transcriptional regulator n=1 Tax=Flavobacterium TaxID=237 RepID=UPI00107529CF|nr:MULTISPECIES: YafY family protein [Flavobacterium]KAF2516292.1 YafY family transcriptional regulator [Flavobacterium salilacus subsp. salilacus]MBE1613822.1 YafY family transcriptional regulator [Flavobacterium sp. SaA2.13]
MNRFDRITAILIQLQSGKVVKAQDIANRFDISLRTVYRDIRTLEEAGVPLYGEAGVGYSLVEGYRLPPVMFTPEEAIAFVTAEKLMEKFTDTALQNNFASALYKVKAVLRSTEKQLLENLEGQIEVKDRRSTIKQFPLNTLDVLLKAIAEKKAVQMKYRAVGHDDDSDRLIEPIGIFHENENWYTVAYCHLRESYRQFRIDRVKDIKLTQQEQQERSTLKEYREREQLDCTPMVQKAVIRTDKKIVPYIQNQRDYYGFISEEVHHDYVDMIFLTHHMDEGLPRWIMMFADYAEVIEPESLKNKILELSEKISEKMKLEKSY